MRIITGLVMMVLIPVYCLCLNAQTVEGSDTSSSQAKTALTFSVNGLYLGGGLGATFYTSKNFSIRTLLNLSYTQGKDLTDQITTYSTSIGATIYFNYHFGKYSGLSPYVGAGLGGLYNQSTYAGSSEIARSGTASIPILGGVEYWFTDHISISAEQSIGVVYNVSSSFRQVRVSTSTSSLLLSFYL